jgi:carbonyl reductase 1
MPRTALVTGGNRGLGLETCRQLAARGLRVLAASRSDDVPASIAALAGEGLGVEHRALDVADPDSVAARARALAAAGVALDVVVHNAGVALDGFDAAVARRTLDVNFHGALRVTDGLLGLVPAGGRIVMVSSGMGELSCVAPPLHARLASPALTRGELVALVEAFVEDVARGRHRDAGWPSSAYRVSKVALNALVRVLARDLAPRGIGVDAVCPGWVRTDMGGPGADRSVAEGAASIVWAATRDAGAPTGGFYRDGAPIPW